MLGGGTHILVYICMDKKHVETGLFAVERVKQVMHLGV